jgi:hypothetical protein
MIIHFTKYIFFLSLIVFYSCNTESKFELDKDVKSLKNSTENLTLKLVDTLNFNLDKSTPAKTFHFNFKIIGKTPYYIMYNEMIHSLQFYNFNSENVYKVIKLEDQGPNALKVNQNFYFHKWDSIFFINSTPSKISLFDSSGRKKKSWSPKLNGDDKNSLITTLEYYYHPYYDSISRNITFCIIPRNYTPSNHKFYQLGKAVEYNLSTNKYNNIGQYSYDYSNGKNLYTILIGLNGYSTDKYHITHNSGSADVSIYDRKTSVITKLRVKSKFLSDEVKPSFKSTKSLENDLPIDEKTKCFISTGFYEDMFSNETFNYHYRIVKHDADYILPDGRSRSRNEFPFSIIILDKDFNFINEIKFPESQFNYRQSFAYKNRLYINLNNSLNKNIDEDHLKFAVYELTPDKI